MKNKKILFLVLLSVGLAVPFISNAADALCAMVGRIETITWQIGGSIVVIGWVIAGILYLTAAGSPEKTGIAKKALIAAIIGSILVVLSAVAAGIIQDTLGRGIYQGCGQTF